MLARGALGPILAVVSICRHGSAVLYTGPEWSERVWNGLRTRADQWTALVVLQGSQTFYTGLSRVERVQHVRLTNAGPWQVARRRWHGEAARGGALGHLMNPIKPDECD